MNSPLPLDKERCCLITGGAGNLAGHIAWALAENFDQLVLTDISAQPPTRLPENACYEPMDIGDLPRLERMVQNHRPNAIVHLASRLSGSSETDHRRTWHVNTTATLEILEQALSLPKCRVLFASTLATYGGNLPKIIPEDQSQWPSTFYGVTKVACERLGNYAREVHGLDFRCLRLPVVLSQQAPPNAVSAMVSRAFIESAEAGRFIFRARPQTKIAALYIKDAIRGFVTLLHAPKRDLHQPVYNLGGFTATLAEFSEEILKRLPEVEHRFEPDLEVEKVLSQWPASLEDSAARRDWHWNHEYDLEATCTEFIGGGI